jgi:hypothetical protein
MKPHFTNIDAATNMHAALIGNTGPAKTIILEGAVVHRPAIVTGKSVLSPKRFIQIPSEAQAVHILHFAPLQPVVHLQTTPLDLLRRIPHLGTSIAVSSPNSTKGFAILWPKAAENSMISPPSSAKGAIMSMRCTDL